MSEVETQPQSLYEFFEEFLDDAVARFPQMKDRLMIADGNEERAHTRMEGVIRREALDFLNGEAEDKESCSFHSPDKRFFFVVINELVPEEERFHLSEETRKHLHFVLDHELAHMCIENGASDKTFFDEVVSECVADAYALIRHFQRYGTEDYRHSHVDPFRRSRNLIMHEPQSGKSHFTAFVLEEIIKLKDQIDFGSLDNQQTATLAWRFAMKNVPPLPVIERLCKIYMPVRQAMEREDAEAAIKALADITLNPENGYFTFRMGRLWLARYIEDRTLTDGTPINLPKEYLDDVAKRLKEQEFRLAAEDILFNMPVKTSQIQAAKLRKPELAW